ncbi:MAG: polyketide synthase dehydratase domain-containing protein, partial [Candidatus Heimdallarchaeota archaeon]
MTARNKETIDCGKYPLIDKILVLDSKTIIGQKTLSLETDHFMRDHCFNNIPVLPGVIGLELFAEFASIIQPGITIKEILDVEFFSAVRLKNNQPKTIRVELTVSDSQATATLKLLDMNIDDIGCNSKLCFKARLIFGRKSSNYKPAPTLHKLPLLNKQFIYQILRHGPSFQVLSEINHLNNEVLAIGKYNRKQLFPKKEYNLIIDPLSIEIGFQAMGLFDFINNNRAGLPSAIRQIQFYDFKGKPHFIIRKKKGENDIGSLFDFSVLTKKGEVVLEVSDYQTVEVDLGDTAGILERIRSHAIRQLVGLPRLAWLEVVSFSLLQDKLSREPEFINEFLNVEELQHANQLDQKARFIYLIEIFTQKRALRVILRASDMSELLI